MSFLENSVIPVQVIEHRNALDQGANSAEGEAEMADGRVSACKEDVAIPVQVIEHRNAPDQSAVSAKEELEATLGMKMDHPHIVRTMKFATRERRGAVRHAS